MNNNFCNNCGKLGHSYHKCRRPIISLGIIVFRYNPNIEFLLVRRRNTLGYVDFIRGKYDLKNTNYIQSLINIMTEDELAIIKTNTFKDLWKNLWRNNEYQYINEYNNSEIKFLEILNKNNIYNIDYFIKNRTTNWTEPEWGFPKGRRNKLECDYKCAIREWEEETGYHRNVLNIISNIVPINEIFLGTNNKPYKYKYYVGIMTNIIKVPDNYEKTEISEVKWCNYEECIKLIRDYNINKIQLLENLYYILQNNTIYR